MPKMTSAPTSSWTSPGITRAAPSFAILPVGSCEQHGSHLPIRTDTFIVDAVVSKVAARTGGFVIPTLPYGTSPEHAGFAGTLSLGWTTLAAVVVDLVRSCIASGIDLVFVVSGHGGNFILNPCLRELNAVLPEYQRAVLVPESALVGPEVEADDLHAGHWETSIMLHLAPDMVVMDNAVDFVPASAVRSDLTNMRIQHVSPSGVWGRPVGSTAEAGAALLEAAAARVAAFIESWPTPARGPLKP